MFIVRAFIDYTITVAVWTSLGSHVCLVCYWPMPLPQVAFREHPENDTDSSSRFAALSPHHRRPTSATKPAGQDLQARQCPGLPTLLLRLQAETSHFWIILLLRYERVLTRKYRKLVSC